MSSFPLHRNDLAQFAWLINCRIRAQSQVSRLPAQHSLLKPHSSLPMPGRKAPWRRGCFEGRRRFSYVCVFGFLLSSQLACHCEISELEDSLEAIIPESVPKGGQAWEQGQTTGSSDSPSSFPGTWGCISSLSEQDPLLLPLQV